MDTLSMNKKKKSCVSLYRDCCSNVLLRPEAVSSHEGMASLFCIGIQRNLSIDKMVSSSHTYYFKSDTVRFS